MERDVRDARAVRTTVDALGLRGISCSAVCPGAIRTPMPEAVLGQNPDPERQTIQAAALRRLGAPTNVARVVLFLVSSLSDHITGEHIVVTGGDTMSQ